MTSRFQGYTESENTRQIFLVEGIHHFPRTAHSPSSILLCGSCLKTKFFLKSQLFIYTELHHFVHDKN